MFIVKFSDDWYLRNTVATSDITRASRYKTEQAARDALAKAAKFMKKSAVKSAEIVPID